jgi:hypothetical protein
VTEKEIMKDFDEDKYIKSYCNRRQCHQCEGTDYNGEPNGDGCDGLEKRRETMYNSILRRRQKKLMIDRG